MTVVLCCSLPIDVELLRLEIRRCQDCTTEFILLQTEEQCVFKGKLDSTCDGISIFEQHKVFLSFFQAIVSVKTLVECISAQCTFVRTSKMKGYLNVYFLYFLLIYCLTALKFRY